MNRFRCISSNSLCQQASSSGHHITKHGWAAVQLPRGNKNQSIFYSLPSHRNGKLHIPRQLFFRYIQKNPYIFFLLKSLFRGKINNFFRRIFEWRCASAMSPCSSCIYLQVRRSINRVQKQYFMKVCFVSMNSYTITRSDNMKVLFHASCTISSANRHGGSIIVIRCLRVNQHWELHFYVLTH